MKSIPLVFAALALALTTGVSMPAHAAGKSQPNLVQVARSAGQFQTLLKALDAADLTGTLSGQGHGPFTVFAPTDAAFAKLPPGTLESLLANPAQLKQVLLTHVVAGEYRAAQVLAAGTLKAVNGQELTISSTGGARVNGVAIVATDVAARNGVIHVIDTVLLPR